MFRPDLQRCTRVELSNNRENLTFYKLYKHKLEFVYHLDRGVPIYNNIRTTEDKVGAKEDGRTWRVKRKTVMVW